MRALLFVECLRACRTWCFRLCLALCLTVSVDLTAGLAAVVEAADAFGVVCCVAGAVGAGVELDCAKAGPAIRAVASRPAANFFNMTFSLLFVTAANSHRAVFKHM